MRMTLFSNNHMKANADKSEKLMAEKAIPASPPKAYPQRSILKTDILEY